MRDSIGVCRKKVVCANEVGESGRIHDSAYVVSDVDEQQRDPAGAVPRGELA
jgi:hypothetical protein